MKSGQMEVKIAIEAGADPEKIIFAQTCKNISHIK